MLLLCLPGKVLSLSLSNLFDGQNQYCVYSHA